MLKLAYSETSCNLEYLADSLEDWVCQRVTLALRIGASVALEPSTASFLVPANLPQIDTLRGWLNPDVRQAIAVAASEVGFVEVTISGSWLLEVGEPDAGIFATSLGDRLEMLVFELWKASLAKSPSTVRD